MFKSLLKKSLVLVAALAASFSASAQTQINDEAGLRAIANDLTGKYVLTADITLSEEWAPIGHDAGNNDPSQSFQGEFDGAGHTIKGLKIGGGSDIGFFGHTYGAYIHNVKFVDANVGVYGNGTRAGIVVGNAHETTIEKVFTAGVVNGNDHVGGIAGDTHDGTSVNNCLSTAAIWSSGYQAGGIVGDNDNGTVEKNLFLGQAYSGSSWNGCGGIVGINEGTLSLNDNFAAPCQLGIGEGLNNNHLHAVLGWSTVEGGAAMSNNYSLEGIRFYQGNSTISDDELATLNGNEWQGTVLAKADFIAKANATLTDWNTSTGNYPVLKGMTVPFDGDYVEYEATAELYVGNTHETGATSSIGRNVTVTSSNTAVVKVNGTTIEGVAAGTATITLATTGDNFINGCSYTFTVEVKARERVDIASVADLDLVRQNPNGVYTLTADLDLAGVDFTPLPNFYGTFDGNGHVVRNVRVNTSGTSKVGFFSQITGGVVKNLGIEDSYFNGDADVAALVGWCSGGVIESCYVSNTYIEGRDHVASFTGNMQRQGAEGVVIRNCLSDAQIKTRQYQAGGMAGVANGGTLENCLFSGIIDEPGNTNVGGLVSLLDNNDWQTYTTTMRNNLAAPAHMFGAAGYGDNGNGRLIHLAGRGANFENNYITANTLYGSNLITGTTRSMEAGDANDWNGQLVQNDEARTKAFFTETLGWDFNNTWKFFEGTEGKMYPVLAWMKTPLKTLVYNMPDEYMDKYVDDMSGYDVKGFTGSWGQDVKVSIDPSTTASYEFIEDEGRIYYSEEGAEFIPGEIIVNVNADIAGVLTTVGEKQFTITVNIDGVAIQIATPEDFVRLSKIPSGNFELTADIDMAGVEWSGVNSGFAFTGTLNGNGHTVKNLTVKGTGTDFGVFGKTNGATIKNIAFDKFLVDNQNGNHVGFVGSAANTKFEQVALVGTVRGNDHVAVLAGDGSNVTIADSYVNGEVYAYSQVGGFFGCTLTGGATVINSYFNGKLTAYTRGWVGGVVGLIDQTDTEGTTVTVENCASIGDCISIGDGTPHVTAPFIGGNRAGGDNPADWNIIFFHNNIYNLEAEMQGDTDWPNNRETNDGGDVQYAEGLPVSSLQQASAYQNIGWDFSNVWEMGTADYKFPVLKNSTLKNPVLVLGINDVNAGAEIVNGKAYNVMGQQVNAESARGIIIVNGHKFIAK